MLRSPADVFDALDINGDGRLSREEFNQAMASMGSMSAVAPAGSFRYACAGGTPPGSSVYVAPPRLPTPPGSVSIPVSQAAVSPASYVPAVGSTTFAAQASLRQGGGVFERLDTNGDGKLSREEFNQAFPAVSTGAISYGQQAFPAVSTGAISYGQQVVARPATATSLSYATPAFAIPATAGSISYATPATGSVSYAAPAERLNASVVAPAYSSVVVPATVQTRKTLVEVFDRIDANRDGTITREEFNKAMGNAQIAVGTQQVVPVQKEIVYVPIVQYVSQTAAGQAATASQNFGASQSQQYAAASASQNFGASQNFATSQSQQYAFQPQPYAVQPQPYAVQQQPYVRPQEVVTKLDPEYYERVTQVPQINTKIVEEVHEVPEPQIVDRIVEVPQIQEVIRETPGKVEIRLTTREVPKIEVKTVERVEEVPEIEYVDRFVEVPIIHEVVRRIPRIQVHEIPIERIIQVPKKVIQVIEQPVYRPVPHMVRKPVNREIPVPRTTIQTMEVVKQVAEGEDGQAIGGQAAQAWSSSKSQMSQMSQVKMHSADAAVIKAAFEAGVEAGRRVSSSGVQQQVVSAGSQGAQFGYNATDAVDLGWQAHHTQQMATNNLSYVSVATPPMPPLPPIGSTPPVEQMRVVSSQVIQQAPVVIQGAPAIQVGPARVVSDTVSAPQQVIASSPPTPPGGSIALTNAMVVPPPMSPPIQTQLPAPGMTLMPGGMMLQSGLYASGAATPPMAPGSMSGMMVMQTAPPVMTQWNSVPQQCGGMVGYTNQVDPFASFVMPQQMGGSWYGSNAQGPPTPPVTSRPGDLFSQLDADGDGVLSREEFQRAMMARPIGVA